MKPRKRLSKRAYLKMLSTPDLDLECVDEVIRDGNAPLRLRLDLAWRLLEFDRDEERSRELFRLVFQSRQCPESYYGVLISYSQEERIVDLVNWGLRNMHRIVPPRTGNERRWLGKAADLMEKAKNWLEAHGYTVTEPPRVGRGLKKKGRRGHAAALESRTRQAGPYKGNPASQAPSAIGLGGGGAAGRDQPTGMGPAQGVTGLAKQSSESRKELLPAPIVVPRFDVSFLDFSVADGGENRSETAALDSKQLARRKLEDWRLVLMAQRLSLTASFDDLLCLEAVEGVEFLRYQVETVRRVLRRHRGRAILADEVGLGKTIEAGLLLKEYSLRGLVSRFLVLCPPSLVSQWRGELQEKFLIPTKTTNDEEYRRNPAEFWVNHSAIVASLHTAKSPRNKKLLESLEFDMLIIDEAHHLKNRNTVAWRFVNSLKRKFLLLLTATPVQNDLGELYNLITLLRPGTLGTPAEFRRTFVKSGRKGVPKDPEKLRTLMRSVMIRNTRSVADLKLPPRRATTYHVTQSTEAAKLYRDLNQLLRELYPSAPPSEKLAFHSLLMRAGSSLVALASSLRKFGKKREFPGKQAAVLARLRRTATKLAGQEAKFQRLQDLLKKGPGKKIVFTQYRDTLHFLERSLADAGFAPLLFHGGMRPVERQKVIALLHGTSDLLLCTEAGAEGQNLQVATTVINYDLPWNPMRIEQRIGRVHRIGQTKPVYVFNLALAGSIESAILAVLEEKINLFELVVGELGVILGNLTEDRDFPDRVVDIWFDAKTDEEARHRVEELGDELVQAKQEYERSARLDETIFGRDFEA